MKAITEQNLMELAETLRSLGDDQFEEKARILQELIRRRPNFDVEPEAGIREVFAQAALEFTAALDNLQLR